jgi:hypothetical protein
VIDRDRTQKALQNIFAAAKQSSIEFETSL